MERFIQGFAGYSCPLGLSIASNPHRIQGYMRGLSPTRGQVVYFFRQVAGHPVVKQRKVLSQNAQTTTGTGWRPYAPPPTTRSDGSVAEKKETRKEDYVLPGAAPYIMEKQNDLWGLLSSFKEAWEQGRNLPHSAVPPPKFSDERFRTIRILAHQPKTLHHYYFISGMQQVSWGPPIIVALVANSFPFPATYWAQKRSLFSFGKQETEAEKAKSAPQQKKKRQLLSWRVGFHGGRKKLQGPGPADPGYKRGDLGKQPITGGTVFLLRAEVLTKKDKRSKMNLLFVAISTLIAQNRVTAATSSSKRHFFHPTRIFRAKLCELGISGV